MIGWLATFALVVATVLAAVSLLPQILKLVRTGDPRGVSATWPAISLVTNAAWSVYLIQAGLTAYRTAQPTGISSATW